MRIIRVAPFDARSSRICKRLLPINVTTVGLFALSSCTAFTPQILSPLTVPHSTQQRVVSFPHRSGHHDGGINSIASSTIGSATNRYSNLLSITPMVSSSPALFLRRILSEDDLATPPDGNVLDTVEKMGKKQLLASDVAVKAGVSLSKAQKSLSALASLTRGDISVTNDGDLLYTFPQASVKATLASNSARYKLQSKWGKDIWPNLFWGIRVAFGISIYISLVAIFGTLLIMSLSGGSSDDDGGSSDYYDAGGSSSDDDGGSSDDYDRRDKKGGGIIDTFDSLLPSRTYYFSNGPSYGYNYGYYGRNDPFMQGQGSGEAQEEEEPSHFEKIFSYIFGDGNPNRELEAARLRGAAEMIRKNGGSVIAEQLASFCDAPDPKSRNDANVDESFVLPLVTQLGGEPSVTEDGDIVYLFPELQVSAMSKAMVYLSRRQLPIETLEEQTLDFNRAGNLSNVFAGGLGIVNLGGALYLGEALSGPALAAELSYLPGLYGIIQGAYPFLLVYAILYNAIPAFRYFYNKKYNAGVQARNSARRRWLTVVKKGGGRVRRKLNAAASMRRKMRRLGGKVDVVYDTKTDFSDVAAKKEKEDMKRFDDLLNDDKIFQ